MISPPNVSSQTRQNTGCLLLAGIVIATLTEAIAGTALTLGKGDIIGDVYATPDEFAWLDIGYTTLKMIAFLLASWIATTVNLRIIVVAATVMITLVSAATALTTRLDLLIGLRAFQGFSGGLLLVIGQTVIFRDFSPSRQPCSTSLVCDRGSGCTGYPRTSTARMAIGQLFLDVDFSFSSSYRIAGSGACSPIRRNHRHPYSL
ncbi:hypothetical protein Brsp07_04324 [Brucella sp. NBRC 14130]